MTRPNRQAPSSRKRAAGALPQHTVHGSRYAANGPLCAKNDFLSSGNEFLLAENGSLRVENGSPYAENDTPHTAKKSNKLKKFFILYFFDFVVNFFFLRFFLLKEEKTMKTLKKAVPFLAAILLATLILPAPACAQTAERLDALLNTERVSFAQAASLILPAAGLLAPEAGETEAFAAAGAWFPNRAEQDDPITMGELSYLVMESFHLTGGFMYALFPGPRYAYRALAWQRLLPPNPDPRRFLSGEELLHITGLALSLAGDEALSGKEEFEHE
jgi:hypothetical protein